MGGFAQADVLAILMSVVQKTLDHQHLTLGLPQICHQIPRKLSEEK